MTVLKLWFCVFVSNVAVLLCASDVSVAQVIESGPLKFGEQLIMDGYAYSFGLAAADFDGDGDLDLSSADALPNNSLYWFENDGKGTFKKHFVQRNDPERLERHAVGDIDQDGKLDIVIVKNLFGDLLWFQNSGTPADGTLWTRHVITRKKLPGAYDVALADYDGDGDLDVAASSWRLSNNFVWLENDGTPADGEWAMHMIDENVAETRMVRAADIDGDGDPDLVGSARVAPLVVWYENETDDSGVIWKKHVIDDQSVQPIHGEVVDLDGDGDLDLLMALGMTFSGSPDTEQIAWYENDGSPARGKWEKHLIRKGLHGAFEAVAADLDGDQDLDVVATAWGERGQVFWLENTGEKRDEWPRHMLKDNWQRANQVIIADFNGDGRPDIAAGAERNALEVRWWENLGKR